MQHLGTDTGSSGPHWGEKEHNGSMHVPLMTGTEASHGPEILASKGNPTSHAQLMVMVTCDRIRLARIPGMALALIAVALSLKPS